MGKVFVNKIKLIWIEMVKPIQCDSCNNFYLLVVIVQQAEVRDRTEVKSNILLGQMVLLISC